MQERGNNPDGSGDMKETDLYQAVAMMTDSVWRGLPEELAREGEDKVWLDTILTPRIKRWQTFINDWGEHLKEAEIRDIIRLEVKWGKDAGMVMVNHEATNLWGTGRNEYEAMDALESQVKQFVGWLQPNMSGYQGRMDEIITLVMVETKGKLAELESLRKGGGEEPG